MPETLKRKRPTPPAVTTHKQIRAEGFVLVDSDGVERAHLSAMKNETVLAMYDQRGGLRLALHASDRETVLNIFDKYDGADKDRRGDTVELLRLGYEINTKDQRLPGLRIFDKEEDERVSVRVVEEGGTIFVTDDLGGRYSSISGDGLSVYDVEDNLLADFCVSAKESAAVEEEDKPAAPTPDVIHEGERNQSLTSVAGRLRRQGCSATEILATLQATNQQRCQPPLDPREVAAIARDQAAPAPSNRFDVPSKFNALAEGLAINLVNVGDDELLSDLTRLAFTIAGETDYLNREMLALAVANQALTRTCEFSKRLNIILDDARPA